MNQQHSDHVARDPATGRPLHEFVVDPLAVPPTALPTEGEPYGEPGTVPVHETDRGKPRLVVAIDKKMDHRMAAKEVVRLIRRAQRETP